MEGRLRSAVRLVGPALAAVVTAAAAAASVASCSSSSAAPGPDDAGCPNDLPASCPSPTPSYQGGVSQILAAKCLTCHGAGGFAQSSRDLSSYDRIYTSRGVMLNQVYECLMPLADGGQLTPEERASLLGWLVCDAPNN